MRPKTCPHCRQKYQPERPMQPCCDAFECKAAFIAAHVAKQRQKRAQAERIAQREDRKTTAIAKDKRKTITRHAADTQKHVNALIRFRDKDKPCISCGRPLRGTFHAGHYKPVGKGLNWAIRYHHDNIFGQCVQCNTYKGGNQAEMRKGVLDRIGQERLDWIEGPHPDAKFTVEQLKQIAADHRSKLKELKNGR